MKTGKEVTMSTAATTATKPAYLDLLNQISLAESRAGVYLKAWAEVTPDPELRQALSFVAARETAHGEVFRQRIERLGFRVQDREDPKFAERVRIYGDPTISDCEKIQYSRSGRAPGDLERRFASIEEQAADESVDPLTRDTLRWYVQEERDSNALLQQVYARIEAMAGGSATDAAGPTPSGGNGSVSTDAQAIMECMTQGFAGLQQSLKDLIEALGKSDRGRTK